MYVRRLTIQNLRAIKHVDVKFERADGSVPRWCVVTGPNGCGKTTLLQAIALSLMGELIGTFYPRPENWIRRTTSQEGLSGEPSTNLDLSLDVEDWNEDVAREYSVGVFPHVASIQQRYVTTKNSPRFMLSRSGSLHLVSHSSSVAVAYGSSRVLRDDPPSIRQDQPSSLRWNRLSGLLGGSSTLIEGVKSLQDQYITSIDTDLGDVMQSQALRFVTGAIELINDGLLPDNTRLIAVNSKHLTFERGNVVVQLDELSDGYRNTVALVLDLLAHLQADGGSREKPAVVLIDEPELHLHPSWQRRLGDWLKDHFPRVQFIVATHSPYIAQAADEGGIIRLRATEDGVVGEQVDAQTWRNVVNGSADIAAVDLFGLPFTHSDEAEEGRKKLAKLEEKILRKAATAEEIATFKTLRAQQPSNASVDVEIALRRLKTGSQ